MKRRGREPQVVHVKILHPQKTEVVMQHSSQSLWKQSLLSYILHSNQIQISYYDYDEASMDQINYWDEHLLM